MALYYHSVPLFLRDSHIKYIWWWFGTSWSVAQSGSSFCAVSQARILKQVAISFSRGSSQPRDSTCISCITGIFFYWGANRDLLHPKFPQTVNQLDHQVRSKNASKSWFASGLINSKIQSHHLNWCERSAGYNFILGHSSLCL